ncbi:complex I subunit 5 family protein [Methylosinus sp. KRF6]|uniref:complex I subunit 5 family protein n=1 Tax=Methylosinus sp. KRF6 TaxID=2846853 RepID=UPI001C0DD783|nr:complex I subunit 5 family protein [Methylosinus sp. KRF6]MBU3888514.1 complex I subunit 5 family protein [Methylosinus sp. KRF6]
MIETGSALLVLALAAPLAMAALAPLLRRPLRLLPLAATPALAAALFAPLGSAVDLPDVLLGSTLRLDRIGAVFLGFGALLWTLAGAYALGYMTHSERTRSFSIFWLLTLVGALGVFIAADAVTFYLLFAVLSFAAYGLVLHDRTPAARRAGHVYIVLALFGEVALLVAFMLADTSSPTLQFADIRAALTTSPWRAAILAGLLIGFGIKFGLVPAHVWLPLAHSQAPTPASAVLSGVIVAAGVIGLIRFLPLESADRTLADGLIALGLVTAYFGIIVGLMQTSAKVILAYSTLSQMGLIVTVLASAMSAPGGAGAAIDAATLYALHHGLAKAALFMTVGLAARNVWPSRPVMCVTVFTALAIAGFPLSGGALAKLAMKGSLGNGIVAWLVTLSAVGTTMLMLRFLWALSLSPARAPSEGRAFGLLAPWLAMAGAALALSWLMFPTLSGHSWSYAASPANLWSALWPVLLAPLLLALPRIDLVATVEAMAHRLARFERKFETRAEGLSAPRRFEPTRTLFPMIDAVERGLRHSAAFGPLLILIAALMAFAFGSMRR